jgi:murein L,D-transpeptidase YafK
MKDAIRRTTRFALAVSPLLLGGCQTVPGSLAGLLQALHLAPPPPAPPRVLPRPTPVPAPTVADRVVVFKSTRTLELLHDGRVFETFPIALGEHPIGPKRQEGDGRTPEGEYKIDWRTDQTRWTRELHISYPSDQDRAAAAARHVDPGGAIFIHGLPSDYGPFDPPAWYRDWTNGCISVGNAAIVKIWDAVPEGTPIDIFP